ncbi:MAG: hypothetical protein U5K79_17225 [Cyclobacteriaceae bacterium]|nr:hypothetical protein [Cyclobacteriaceae bacterium]
MINALHRPRIMSVGQGCFPNLTIVSQGRFLPVVQYSGTQEMEQPPSLPISGIIIRELVRLLLHYLDVQAGPFASGQVIVSGQSAVCPVMEMYLHCKRVWRA